MGDERTKSGSAYLLVELSDIVVGLVLRLNEGRVLLNVLCVRHLCTGSGKVGFLLRDMRFVRGRYECGHV